MKTIHCQNCGSSELKKEGSYWVCQYCGSKNYLTEEELPARESEITLDEDVNRLMKKWDSEPDNADKYARLILQIDPNNTRALDQLNKKKGNGGCYIATAVYGSYDCPEVWTLRRYRDNKLAETVGGRLFIKTYYSISPTLVKYLGDKKWFINAWKLLLDRMVINLKKEGFRDTPYQDKY